MIDKTNRPRCSWKDCQATGYYKQIAKDGEVWSILCEFHDNMLTKAIESGDPKAIVSTWAKAHGNAKNFAKRMMGE